MGVPREEQQWGHCFHALTASGPQQTHMSYNLHEPILYNTYPTHSKHTYLGYTDYTAPARQHGGRSNRSGNGSTLEDLDHDGIDFFVPDVETCCARMSHRNRKQTAVDTRGQVELPLCCRYLSLVIF